MSQKSRKAAVLAKTAKSMRTTLDAVASARFVHRRVSEVGLELVLERQTDERLRLAMARSDREPSSEERMVVGAAFGTPEGCEWSADRRVVRGHSMFISEVIWRER